MSIFHQAKAFLTYQKKAINRHGAHSPFLYHFLDYLAKNRKLSNPAYQQAENYRKNLLKDHQTTFEKMDFGAGSHFRHVRRSIAQECKNSSIVPKYGRLLHQILSYFQPSVGIELGSCLGVSTFYQYLAFLSFPEARFYSIEGDAALSAYLQAKIKHWPTASSMEFQGIVGNFQEVLPPLLQKLDHVDYAFIDGHHQLEPTLHYFSLFKEKSRAQTILIFDDIHWSEGMEKAWNTIKKDPDIRLSLDFYRFGVVFFNPALSKEDHVIRY